LPSTSVWSRIIVHADAAYFPVGVGEPASQKKWAGAIPAHQQTIPFPAGAYQFQYVQ